MWQEVFAGAVQPVQTVIDFQPWIPVILAVVALVQGIWLEMIRRSSKQANESAKEAKDAVVETKNTIAATSESVDKIHTAVNSERTHMQEELKKLHEEITALSAGKARAEQKIDDAK